MGLLCQRPRPWEVWAELAGVLEVWKDSPPGPCDLAELRSSHRDLPEAQDTIGPGPLRCS